MTDNLRRASELIAEALSLLATPQPMTVAPPSNARLLSVADICVRWRVDSKLVYKIIRRCELLTVKVGDGALRVPLASVEAYEQRQAMPARERT